MNLHLNLGTIKTWQFPFSFFISDEGRGRRRRRGHPHPWFRQWFVDSHLSHLLEKPLLKCVVSMWALPKMEGRGVTRLARMAWSTFFPHVCYLSNAHIEPTHLKKGLPLGKISINSKVTFSFEHWLNHLTPPPLEPISGNLVLLFWMSKFKTWKTHKKKNVCKNIGCGEGRKMYIQLKVQKKLFWKK